MKKNKKDFDAVAMVRKIRDENYRRHRGMSKEEKIADIRKRAGELHQKLGMQNKVDAVTKHNTWQAGLDKEDFFKKVF